MPNVTQYQAKLCTGNKNKYKQKISGTDELINDFGQCKQYLADAALLAPPKYRRIG